MERLRLGVIGLGQRGKQLIDQVFSTHDAVCVTALCDLYQDRVDDAAKVIVDAGFDEPFKTNDYKEVMSKELVDCVVITTSWDKHIEMSIECLERGIPCGCEIGGCKTLDECFALVDAYERTGTPFMFLENCCYGRYELMVLNMVKQGVFGEIVHCSGGYFHDLRHEISHGKELHHYRLNEYRTRNCENYPTHEIGPIAKVLDINHGNRFVRLTSMASKAAGLHEYIKDKKADDAELINAKFAQGDIVTTTIMCERGETIVITLDTTLPRNFYSRGFTVRGTKGMYEEATQSVFIDNGEQNESREENLDNVSQFTEKYEHKIWKKFLKDGVKGGHDGMDYLVFSDFFDCVKNNKPMPIDVYDAAVWMCITPLSEKSIAAGGTVLEIPDFKNRK